MIVILQKQWRKVNKNTRLLQLTSDNITNFPAEMTHKQIDFALNLCKRSRFVIYLPAKLWCT